MLQPLRGGDYMETVIMALIVLITSILGFVTKRQIKTNEELKREVDVLNVRVAIIEKDLDNKYRSAMEDKQNLRYLFERVDKMTEKE